MWVRLLPCCVKYNRLMYYILCFLFPKFARSWLISLAKQVSRSSGAIIPMRSGQVWAYATSIQSCGAGLSMLPTNKWFSRLETPYAHIAIQVRPGRIDFAFMFLLSLSTKVAMIRDSMWTHCSPKQNCWRSIYTSRDSIETSKWIKVAF